MIKKWMDAWGYYLLAALCVGVIVFSAVWTRSAFTPAAPDAAALSDESQRLAAVTPSPAPPSCHAPADGAILRHFSAAPVYFSDTGLWCVHPAVDYAASPGDPIYAVMAGTVTEHPEGVAVSHENGLVSVYWGIDVCLVEPGAPVRAGDIIARASANVPFEGTGHVCVSLYAQDQPIDWENPIDSTAK
ncbi:MAG: M23 family metallopeptidase [Clostridia bacterium]|nr:M23 family metallopeptidase [Clostridia bacterium]